MIDKTIKRTWEIETGAPQEVEPEKKINLPEETSYNEVIMHIKNGQPIPHSIIHEGACIVREPHYSESCQICGVIARIAVDTMVLCWSCGGTALSKEQKKAVKKYEKTH